MKRDIGSALIVCTRRIGDVLLATPVIRSLKTALPHLMIDMLVFEGTQDILSGYRDLRRVLTISERPSAEAHLDLLRSIWSRYDVAISVLAGDRPTFHAWAAGRYRVGTLLPDNKSWWKRRLLHEWVPFDNVQTHTVAMNLQLLEPFGVTALGTPVVSWTPGDEVSVQSRFPQRDVQRYAVLHVSPKFAYKTWTVGGWIALGRWLMEQGITVVIAGVESAETAYCAQIVQGLPGAVNLVGHVTLPALGCLLSRAALYVGTDTAVSHMAAAVGTPSVVLFGPSNPVKWGPWPKDFPPTTHSPWRRHGSQRQGNVFLLQGEGDCVPCLGEGCDRHIKSLSDCLQQLPVHRVIQAAETMLGLRECLVPISGLA
ncbi:MAG: glycosyltransferase family 9 protein [Nitrospira sp.]|nr:glycosyltransferase family 9 protein [Nitrospira sp.]